MADPSVLGELQELLAPFNESGKQEPLPLLWLSSAKVHEQARTFCRKKRTKLSPSQAEALQHAKQQQQLEELQFFETHIGPRDTILEGAYKLVKQAAWDETFSYVTGYESFADARFADPSRPGYVEGPEPDFHIYMGLFLGKDEETQSRQLHQQQIEDGEGNELYQHISRALQPYGTIRSFPVLELARNILKYLAERYQQKKQEYDHASSVDAQDDNVPPPTHPAVDLLCFCATYGLSHAMKHVLQGKYGPVPPDLTIDTPLPLFRPNRCQHEDPFASTFLRFWCYGMPCLGIGALLGYPNVVEFAVQVLGASLVAPNGFLSKENGTMELIQEERVGTECLRWVIQANRPEMIVPLVKLGVQFRWLTNRSLEQLFECLFHCGDNAFGDEYGPRWHPNGWIAGDQYISMSDVRRARAKMTFRQKQKVLFQVIAAGIPLDLFVPTIDLSVEARIEQLKTEKDLHEVDKRTMYDLHQNLPAGEQKARNLLARACSAYNSLAKKETKSTKEGGVEDNDDDGDSDQISIEDDTSKDEEVDKEEGDNDKGDAKAEPEKAKKPGRIVTVAEYRHYLSNLWKEHESSSSSETPPQLIQLEEFEEADPRWRAFREKQRNGKSATTFDAIFQSWWEEAAKREEHHDY